MSATGTERRSRQRGSASSWGAVALLASGAALSACAQTATPVDGCAPGNPVYVGHYYLNGVREVGSEILLKRDGSFEFMLAYGANDQYGRGCWTLTGSTLSLVPAGRSAASRIHTPHIRGFKGLVLQAQGRDLVWDIAGSGHRGRYEKGTL